MHQIQSNLSQPQILFKLNHKLLQSNLPKVSTIDLKKKEINPFIKTLYERPKIILKKPLTIINMPQRFKKNNNRMEINMTLFKNTSLSFHSKAIKTCSASFYKPDDQNSKQMPKNTLLNKNHSKILVDLQQKKKHLNPKTLQGIQKFFEQKFKIKKQIQNCKPFKQASIIRSKEEKNKQISQLYHQNKHLYMLSRFTLLELKSYYCAILNFSKGDIDKFRHAFEIMLSLADVAVRDSIINQSLKELMGDRITFSRFLKSFTVIQEKLRKEAIIDYFEILLEEFNNAKFTYEDLLKIFKGRMKKEIANVLADLLYDKLEKDLNDTICKRDIQTLCYKNQYFCHRFYTLNHENMVSTNLNRHDENYGES